MSIDGDMARMGLRGDSVEIAVWNSLTDEEKEEWLSHEGYTKIMVF